MLWLALLGSVTAWCRRSKRWSWVLRVTRLGFTDRYDDCAGRPGRPPDLRRRGASPVLEVDVDDSAAGWRPAARPVSQGLACPLPYRSAAAATTPPPVLAC